MNEDGPEYSFSGELNPLAVALLSLGILALLASNRQNALKSLLGVAVLVPMGQQFNVLGLHFMFFRVLISVGLMRVVWRRDYEGFHMNKVDKLMIVWALIQVVCGAIREYRAQQLGFAYDALGVYFLVRILTKEPEDVLGPLRLLCLLSLIVAAVMCFETATRRNPFGVMGGVPLVDQMRDGKARAQGPFQGPIPAGTFGSTLFPLMIGLWLQGGDNKRAAFAGIIACLVITITSVSSGAIMTIMVACLGLPLWWMRDRMRVFRRGVVVILIALNMVMKVPVWWIIAKISDIVGGGGWYRSWLIDITIRQFSSWWLIGDAYTHKWEPIMWTGPSDLDNLDITNYYVWQCILGGIWMPVVFIAILVYCFQIVGRLVRSDDNLAWKRTFIWTFGVSLAAYCTTFISMCVYGQSGVFWYWQLAVLAGLPAYVISTDTAEESVAEPVSGNLTKAPGDSEIEPIYSPNSP